MAYIVGKGAVFKWTNTGLQTIVQAENIKPAASTLPAVRFSPTNGTESVLVAGGLLVPGDVSLTIAWDPDDTQHAALYAAHVAATNAASEILFVSSGFKIDYAGSIITSWDPQGWTADDLQKVAITIAVGGITITP